MNLTKKFTFYFLLFLFLFFLHSCNIAFYNPFIVDTYGNTTQGENQVATPVLNPPGGTYGSDQDVAITCATGGATIYYTTNGIDPDGGSDVYSGSIPVTGYGTNMTIKAIAIKSGMLNSSIVSETYIITDEQVETPVMDPVGNTYNSDQSVTITCSTSGATVFYTTDGSDPDDGSDPYSGAIPVIGNGTNMTIKAIGIKTGMLDSTIASEVYTITYDQVAIPVLSPVGGTYNCDQDVTITCGTGGAIIYYTTDNTDPDENSTEYSGPIRVVGNGMNMTIKAIGIKPGIMNSSIASESYSINYYEYVAWGNSLNITINANILGLGNDVPQFPLLVRLNTSNFPDIETMTKSGGADIRFAKPDGTSLYYEVDEWVDNTSGSIWVLIDNISYDSTTSITMFYNNPGASDDSHPELVFNTTNGFQGVWHLGKDPTGTIYDATSNNNHGTANGGMNTSDIISTELGMGLDFEGGTSYQYIDCGNDSSLNLTQNMAFSFWINLDSQAPAGMWPNIVGNGSEITSGWRVYINENSNNVEMGYKCIDTNIYWPLKISIPMDTWRHIYIRYDYSSQEGFLYINGDYVGSSTDIFEIYPSTDNFYIADYYFNGNLDAGLDEVRISSVTRSADWVKLCYHNQRSDSILVDIQP